MSRARMLLLAALVLPALTAATRAQPAPIDGTAASAAASAPGYFVDFRSRRGLVFGHTYLVIGRMDAAGRILDARYVGFYPRPKYYALVPFLLPVPGDLSVEAADHRRPPTAIYRRRLSAQEHARLMAAIRHLHAHRPLWHPLFYNCNDFAIEAAWAIGLRTPPSMELPPDFVRDLARMNGPGG